MKKLSVLFLSLVALATTVTSCSKNDNPAPAATALQLTIKDATLGTVVPNATVKLYGTLNDLEGSTNQVGATMTSDANGKVTFSGLSAIIYYFDISSGCKTNLLGNTTYTTTTAIAANKTTTLDAKIADTSGANFTNNSTTNGWGVAIGGTGYYVIPANTITAVQYPIPAGTYTLTMQELDANNNATSTPAKTFSIDVACGATEATPIIVP